MMRGAFRAAAVGLWLVGTAVPLVAHHAFSAEFDSDKPFTLTGTITKLEWINPHAWLWVEVKGDDGKLHPALGNAILD